MRPARFAIPLALGLVVALAACGSAETHTSATTKPARPKLALAPAAGRAAAAIYPQPPSTYVLDGTLPNLGAVAPVRTLLAHDVSGTDLTRIVTALGMHGTPESTATGYALLDGDATLAVDTSGATTMIEYSDYPGSGASGGSAAGSTGNTSAGSVSSPPSVGRTDPPIPEPVPLPMPTVPPPVAVPSAADAAGIAQSLLDQLGVLSGQEWSHNVLDAGGVASSCPIGADCPAQAPAPVYERTVTYELVIDGAPVPSVSWSVTIGQHARVESLSGVWARAHATSDYPLRSTANVFADLQHNRAQYASPQPMVAPGTPDNGAAVAPVPETVPAVDVHITGVSLGTARADGTANGRAVAYLVPTYRFHAKVAGGDPYDIEVIALDPASFTLAPAPVPVAQPLAGKEVQK